MGGSRGMLLIEAWLVGFRICVKFEDLVRLKAKCY